jgi:micrococcal nuclease
MKSIRLLAAVAALAATTFFAKAPAVAAGRTFTPEFTAKVIHVDDGDTVVALAPDNRKLKVRLANIDAPETDHGRCRPSQPWAQQSTQRLKELVHGKTILFRCSQLDRYDRLVCDLHVGGTTANRALVKDGLAWANRSNPRYLRDPQVARAEQQAQAERVGLWRDKGAIPPWEWRHKTWGTQPGCGGSKDGGWL